MTEHGSASTQRSTLAYLCPNCRAGLLFDPAKGRFCCEFCLSEFTEAELSGTSAAEQAREAEKNAQDFCGEMNDYLCSGCGAEIVADEHTAADICPYCHNPVLLQGKLSGQMRPDRVVPFAIDREGARSRFLSWAKKKWLAPRDFTAGPQLEKLQGIYYPFWVTDADTDSEIHAHATRSRSFRRGDYVITETSHYGIVRGGEIHFEDISTAALKEADKEMLEGVLPYPSDALIPFSMPYLSGFVAKKRSIERAELTEEVRGRMHGYAADLLRSTVRGYATVSVTDCDVRIQKSHWEYSLFPIWMLVYKGKKKSYTFALNGHTGKLYGEVPISPLKLALLGLATFAVSALAFFLLGGAVL